MQDKDLISFSKYVIEKSKEILKDLNEQRGQEQQKVQENRTVQFDPSNAQHKDLFKRARNGDGRILGLPLVDRLIDEDGETPLHKLANAGNAQVIYNMYVDKLFDKYGDTPLHKLAQAGNISVLKHSSVDKVRDTVDGTPLHRLADAGNIEALKHPLADKVKDKNGKTPKDVYQEHIMNVTQKKLDKAKQQGE